MKEGSFLKYLYFRVYQYPLGLSVDRIDHIIELVNEWFQTGKFIKIDTTFSTYSTHENQTMAALALK